MISIIIPILNEAESLPKLLSYLKENIGNEIAYEILICDAGSTDASIAISQDFGARVILCKHKQRASQMNEGADNAKGNILYFLHADSFPPASFGKLISSYCSNGFESGCFRLSFDQKHWLLRFTSWITRFNLKNYQFGDQSLFVRKQLFEKIGGYNADYRVMEDVEIVKRLKKFDTFIIAPHYVVTSARRYLHYGVVKTEARNLLIYVLFLFGSSPKRLTKRYRKISEQNNNQNSQEKN